MPRKDAILLTFSQIGLGAMVGLIGGWLCLFIFEDLLWSAIIENRVQHGFWIGLLLLISFGVTYGTTVIGVAESVRFVGRKFGGHVARKGAYQGAFLGAPAIVAIMSLLNIHWAELSPQNPFGAFLMLLLRFLAFLITLPLNILLLIKCPPELLYILAGPIGAILGYRFSRSESSNSQPLTEDP